MIQKFCRNIIQIPILLLAIIFFHCNSTRSNINWGEDATISPGLDRIGESAAKAALQPETWTPIAAAALLAITGTDEKIQEWASQNTPIFGSSSKAKKASDDLVRVSLGAYLASVIITPGGDDIPDWLLNKTKGLIVGISAIWSTQFLTSELKNLTGKVRPDSSNNKSFPSGHTSAVAVNSLLTTRNIEYLDINTWAENSVKIALHTLTLATGWARLEANVHYSTDVLIGAALGNFIGAFLNDTFLGRYSDNVKLSSRLSADGFLMNIYFKL